MARDIDKEWVAFESIAVRCGRKVRRLNTGTRGEQWTVWGSTLTVHFYPYPRSIYVNGTSGKVFGLAADAIRMAVDGQVPSENLPRRQRKQCRATRGAKRRLLAAHLYCAYCAVRLDRRAATLDHRIPLARGGTHGVDNLVLACLACNRAKANLTPAEWVEMQKESM